MPDRATNLTAEYLGDEPLIELVPGSAPRSRREDAGRADLVLVGTGGPTVRPCRGGISSLLMTDQTRVVVDTGNGVVAGLAGCGVAAGSVSHIFLTHLHLDHVADLGYLLAFPWITEPGTEPAVVIGPPGTAALVNRLFRAFEYDFRSRIPQGFDPGTLRPSIVEVQEGAVIEGADWVARTIRVDHDPVDHAYGFRFDLGPVSVVFSGDTRPTPNLVEAAQGAGTLVHEALKPGYGIPAYHTLSSEVGAVARRCNVRHLVLSHLIPDHLPDSEWLEDIVGTFDGLITVGRDRTRIPLR